MRFGIDTALDLERSSFLVPDLAIAGRSDKHEVGLRVPAC